MEAGGGPGEDRTLLRAGLIADGNDIGEELAGFKNVENRSGLFLRNINAFLSHYFHGERIQRTRLQASAVRFKKIAADMVQPCLRHLTPGTVVDTDKENTLFHSTES